MAIVTLHTDGKRGLWSNHARKVEITKINLGYFDFDDGYVDYSELRVYFTKRSWNTEKHGLIYTDRLFERELRQYLKSIGLSGDVDYSEAGMQGHDYVSLDASKAFVQSWAKWFGIDVPRTKKQVERWSDDQYIAAQNKLEKSTICARTLKKKPK